MDLAKIDRQLTVKKTFRKWLSENNNKNIQKRETFKMLPHESQIDFLDIASTEYLKSYKEMGHPLAFERALNTAFCQVLYKL